RHQDDVAPPVPAPSPTLRRPIGPPNHRDQKRAEENGLKPCMHFLLGRVAVDLIFLDATGLQMLPASSMDGANLSERPDPALDPSKPHRVHVDGFRLASFFIRNPLGLAMHQ
ncbi:hypothetical protein ACHAWF_000376, partial [Thalassiosira exigua]